MKSFYGRKVPYQYKGEYTRIESGLNNYNEPTMITDNHLSDMLDGQVLTDDVMELYQSVIDIDKDTVKLLETDDSLDVYVYEAIAGQESTDAVNIYYFLCYGLKRLWFIRKVSHTIADNTTSVDDYPVNNDGMYFGGLTKNLIPDGHFADRSGQDTNNITYYNNRVLITGTTPYTLICNPITFDEPKKPRILYAFKYRHAGGFLQLNLLYSYISGGSSFGEGTYKEYPATLIMGYRTSIEIVSIDDETLNIDCSIRFNNQHDSSYFSLEYVYAIDVTNDPRTDQELKDFYRNVGYIDEYKKKGLGYYSSAVFMTEKDSYVVFSSSTSDKLLYYTNGTTGYVQLPFSPKKIVTHTNRLFAIDTQNKVWWSRIGDITSWYGVEYNVDSVMPFRVMKNIKYNSYSTHGMTWLDDIELNAIRPITCTTIKKGIADNYGTVTITGINAIDEEIEEEIEPLANQTVQTIQSFKVITKIEQTGHSTNEDVTDLIMFGVAPVGSGFVQDDAGYATVESEMTLSDLCVLSGNLFIFSPRSIHIFRGNQPDNFSLSQFVNDVGMNDTKPPTAIRQLTVIKNTAYFMYSDNLYEFNGYDMPRPVSHKVEVHGSTSNYVYGGVKLYGTDYSVVSDNENVYVYSAMYSPVDTESNYYYIFNPKNRTWTKMSGITISNDKLVRTVLFRSAYHKGIVSAIGYTGALLPSNDHYTQMYVVKSDGRYMLGHYKGVSPYVITKAFSGSPSENLTMTSLILSVQGDTDTTTDLEVSASKSAKGNVFTTFKRLHGFKFTGDMQVIEVPLPPGIVARDILYRIKIQSTNRIRFHNIERRFRVLGHSR